MLKKINHLWGVFLVVAALLAGVAAFVSCGGSRTSSASDAGTEVKMKYADYLAISEHPGFTEVTVKNPWDSLHILQRYILVPSDSVLPTDLPNGTVVRTPVTNSLVYSAVHTGLLEELGAADAIGGVCDAQYINDTTLKRRLADGTLTDCGIGQNPDVEKIIKMRPQIIMLSPYDSKDKHARVGELGIPVIECADYMETSALGRAEWMKFFGMLFGQSDKAEKIFQDIETEYLDLREKAATAEFKPKVLFDQRYGQAWYVPGRGSTLGRIIKDAGGINPFDSYCDGGAAPLAPEKVLAEAHDADVWFVRYNQAGEKTLAELAEDFPMNSRFKAFKEGKVYGCNTSTTHLFEETPFHPERLLRDMVLVMHPGLLGTDSLTVYYKKMK